MQLGAGTAWFCLSQCAIPFCTLSPQKERIYPLSKNEREEVQNFVEDQLRKGYIRLLKSPQMLPVFFVGKKDGSKWMVMDYRNLNSQMVKNNYPLPLITELIDNMEGKKVFTKMDLRWGFNNIRIKKGDEWKGAFTTHIVLGNHSKAITP